MALPKGLTFTHTTGATYTTGNRGKPPSWLYDHPDYKKLETTPMAKAITTVSDSALKFWKWSDQVGEDGFKAKVGVCIVAADNANHAMQILARRFPKNPVYSAEFNLLWKPFESDGSIKTPGVYELNSEKILSLKTT